MDNLIYFKILDDEKFVYFVVKDGDKGGVVVFFVEEDGLFIFIN